MKLLDRNALLVAILSALALAVAVHPQSTSQNFPTPITTGEVTGTIKPRDVGDARLTSYYYQFDGSQGDLFINIVTRNFTGDIDVFTQSGLRPLTKIVVYADFAETETGRVIYLRKPEKMILRVQGRTPGDDPATFRIKFAGSFVASTLPEPAGEPELPKLTARSETGIRVNSVGTIVEVIPKATPTPVPTDVAELPEERAVVPVTEEPKTDVIAEATSDEKPAEVVQEETKIGVVVTENIPPATTTSTPPVRRRTRGRRTPPAQTSTTPDETTATPPSRRTRRGRAAVPPKTTTPAEPDPLAKVNLVILFKDGRAIERPMSEVLRFTVDKGVLTVIAKDGSVGRYAILDVAKVTIE
jgi:hypothetical protein